MREEVWKREDLQFLKFKVIMFAVNIFFSLLILVLIRIHSDFLLLS